MAHENATPRPWKVDPTYLSEVQTEADETISSCWYANCEGVEVTLNGVRQCEPEESAANAALIVEAVNAYDTLRAENERLRAGLRSTLALIDDYLAYRHDGDPWSEDARLMGEMEINYAAKDGRLEAARAALSEAQP